MNMAMEQESYEVDSCVGRFHIYKDCWVPTIGEELECKREIRNMADQYAMAVIKAEVGNQVVGHLQEKYQQLVRFF